MADRLVLVCRDHKETALNYCIPMPNGSLHTLTTHDAEILEAFLEERLVHGGESDQPATLNMLRHVRLAMAPEAQYAEVYAPRGYEPAWQAAA